MGTHKGLRMKLAQIFKYAERKTDPLRLIKFCLVGLTGTLINMGLLWLLTEYARFPYLISAAIAIETAINSNFVFHNFFTFSDRRSPSIKLFFLRLLKYNFISLIGLAINIGVLWFLTELAGLYYLLSNLLGIISATFWRYLLSLRWTWKDRNDTA